MQETVFYVAAGETLGTVRDYANAKTLAAPVLARGVAACLKMRLFPRREGSEPYPMEQLAGIAAWQWAMDSDFSEATRYKLQARNSDIVLSSVTDVIDGEEHVFTQLSIPMPEMNTEELAAWLGTEKSRSGLHGELVGFDGSGREVFVLQVENFTVRNRITSLGAPVPASPDYLTAQQVAATVAGGLECSFSADGTDWHAAQTPGDTLVRIRIRSAGGAWSDPFALPAGVPGTPGRDSYTYTAYASDATGNGFSAVPDSSLKYRAEIHADREIAELSAADFAGAVWVKYLGSDGTGTGDMLKSDYDPDGDGRVAAAVSAGTAAAVPWDGVTGKPAAFAPAAHAHSAADIADGARQRMRRAANPSALTLDCPVVVNTTLNTQRTLTVNFSSILETEGGPAHAMRQDDCFTWEYHVKCTEDIDAVGIGGNDSSMVPVSLPDSLPRIGGQATWHVFAVRALWRSGAANGAVLQVSYCYSYGE